MPSINPPDVLALWLLGLADDNEACKVMQIMMYFKIKEVSLFLTAHISLVVGSHPVYLSLLTSSSDLCDSLTESVICVSRTIELVSRHKSRHQIYAPEKLDYNNDLVPYKKPLPSPRAE